MDQTCFDTCLECAAICDYCASACLQEEDVNMMARCIELNIECAALCRTTALFMSLESEYLNNICQLCADICNACSEECDKFNVDHCKKCTEVCHVCAEECEVMVSA